MLNLFEYDDKWGVQVKPEAVLLEPFAKVFDKYKSREDALHEFGYIYFMADFRSDFNDLVNLKNRSEKVLETMGDNASKIKVDDVTKKAIDFYVERQPSISLRHLESMKKALTSLQESLDSINLSMEVRNAITDELEPVYDTMALKRITDIITISPKLISSIKEMEKQVKVELQENSKHVGSGEKSTYEDG
jgi:hypothetical protein